MVRDNPVRARTAGNLRNLSGRFAVSACGPARMPSLTFGLIGSAPTGLSFVELRPVWLDQPLIDRTLLRGENLTENLKIFAPCHSTHRRISQSVLRGVDVKAAAPRPRGVSEANSLDVDEHRARMVGPVRVELTMVEF